MAHSRQFFYRSVLMEIDNELHREDLESLKFLCLPYIPRGKIKRIESGHELFELLEISGNVTENNSGFLLKLLGIIGRKDLHNSIKNRVQVDSEKSESSNGVGLFYETLYKISEDLAPEDVNRLGYLFSCPRNKNISTGTQLFSDLIERNEIGPSKLDSLISSFNAIERKDLIGILTAFSDENSKQEPNYVLSPLMCPVMVSEEMGLPEEQEPFKDTTYYSDDLLNRVEEGLRLSSGPAELGKKSHLVSSFGDSIQTSPKEGLSSSIRKKTRYFNGILPETSPEIPPVTPLPLPRYRMDANPRGICLVIDNQQFTYDPKDEDAKFMKPRNGSDKDTDNIRNCFTNLNFDVQVWPNQTDTEILARFEERSRDVAANTRHNCFVAFILSHGGMHQSNAYVYGSNGRKVRLSDITSMFRPDVCPSLLGKPKLFFLACCLGVSYSKAVPTSLHMPETRPVIQADCEQEDESPTSFICNEQDFLIGYSTVNGAVSFRDTHHGTWYITELTRILSEYYQRESLQHMLVLVNASVAKYHHRCANEFGEFGDYAQVPSPQHTLTKQLWF